MPGCDSHAALECSLGAGHPSLTSHCQERGSGLTGWGRGSGFPAASTITVFVPNREFSKEPELMPRTPSQKNRRKKRRISSIQDENRDPIRKRYEGQEAWRPRGEFDSKVLTRSGAVGTACTMPRGMKQAWSPWSPELMCVRVGVVFDLGLGGWGGFLEVREARESDFLLGGE